MKLNKKIILMFLLFFVFILLLNVRSYAGTQNWDSLNFNVYVNSDGSMDVEETWNIKISNTNTLFKTFDMDSSKYSGITNVQVAKIDNGVEIPLTRIYQEQYHVDSGCYYALPIDSSTFEIAWYVGLDNSTDTRTYKVYYTIEDAIKIYNDCTELYWMFLGKDNAIPGKNITGTIRLPENVSDIEKLRVWAHGDLTGTIERTSTNLVTFSIPSLSAGDMIEVRVVTEENIYDYSTNIYNENMLNSIITEETQWAENANKVRGIMKGAFSIIIAINAIGIIIAIFKVIKYKKEGEQLKEEYGYPKYTIDYFRDIPNENNATPARASYLYKFSNNTANLEKEMPKIFAATMLDLCLKGLIEFEPIDEKNVNILLKEDNFKKSLDLPEDENIIFKILVKAIGSENGSITTEKFAKYAKSHYDTMYGKIKKINDSVIDYHKSCLNIEEKRSEAIKKWKKKTNFYVIILIVLFFLSPLMMFLLGIYISLIVCAIAAYSNTKKISILSERGNIEKEEWLALERYMNDYSLLKEKLVPDVVLWEKFLVYATTFGISKKVIKQLKIVHPEMFANADVESGVLRYGYWNLIVNSNYGENYFESFSNNLGKIYSNAINSYNIANSHSSSGSRRRRWIFWRRRRPEVAEAGAGGR